MGEKIHQRLELIHHTFHPIKHRLGAAHQIGEVDLGVGQTEVGLLQFAREGVVIEGVGEIRAETRQIVADRTGGAERELRLEIEIGLNGWLHLQGVCDIEAEVEFGYRKDVGGVLLTIWTCWVLGDQCICCACLGFENAQIDIPVSFIEKGDLVVEFSGSY